MKKLLIAMMVLFSMTLADQMLVYNASLSAVSSTNAYDITGATSHTWIIQTAQGGTDLTYKIEGSSDGKTWVNLDDTGASQTQGTATTTNAMLHKDNFAMSLMRVNVTAVNGGTPKLYMTYIGRRSK